MNTKYRKNLPGTDLDYFDARAAVELGIERRVHDPHAAPAELPFQRVLTCEGLLYVVEVPVGSRAGCG